MLRRLTFASYIGTSSGIGKEVVTRDDLDKEDTMAQPPYKIDI